MNAGHKRYASVAVGRLFPIPKVWARSGDKTDSISLSLSPSRLSRNCGWS